jgi:hypothetical protein
MTTKLNRTGELAIDLVILTGEELLGRLLGRRENLPASDYGDLEAIVEALPVTMDYEEFRRVKTHIDNAMNAVGAGEAAYEVRLAIRRLRHRYATI